MDILNWGQALLAISFGFVFTWKSIPVIIKVAYVKDLYDKPDGERKVHTRYISNLGGVAIFIAFITSLLFSGFADEITGLSYFIGALIGLFFCGLKDDLIGLSPTKKLFIEVFSALAVIIGMGLSINHFDSMFGINEVPNWIAYPLTLFTLVVVINAYNLIDGIDGLAGGVAAISTAIFGFGFILVGDTTFAFMAFLLCVICIAYLIHNFNPASIFMGDTGSLVIGFLLGLFAIRFIQIEASSTFISIFGNTKVLIPISLLSIPLYDTIRVFARRIIRGESPFKADSDHIHHNLLKMGWGQKRTVLYLYAVTILNTGIVVSFSNLNVNATFLILLVSMAFLLPTNGFKRMIAGRVGMNLEKIFIPKKNIEYYQHLDIKKNPKDTKTTENIVS